MGVLLFLVHASLGQTNYTWTGNTGSWTNTGVASIWTAVPGGANPESSPGINDTVTINQSATAKTISLDPGWAADVLNLTGSTSVRDDIVFNADGYVKTVNFNSSTPHFTFGGIFWEQGGRAITMEQFNIIGSNHPNMRFTGSAGKFVFTNASQITFFQTNRTELANQVDFSGATSVFLKRSTTLASTTVELIQNQSGNAMPFIIGRADNGVQNWTVSAGAHPMMKALQGTQGLAFKKVGSGDVNMGDVDLNIPIANNGGISPDGSYGFSAGLYQGTLTANSLYVEGKSFFGV